MRARFLALIMLVCACSGRSAADRGDDDDDQVDLGDAGAGEGGDAGAGGEGEEGEGEEGEGEEGEGEEGEEGGGEEGEGEEGEGEGEGEEGLLCRPCQTDDDCGTDGNLCLQNNQTGEVFCGGACVAGACPVGYTCEGVGDGAGNIVAEQCVPDDLMCVDIPGPAADCLEANEDIRELERQMWDLLNDDRADNGDDCACHDALGYDDDLARVARAHSCWMAERGVLSHDQDGLSPFDRIDAGGIQWLAAGENVAGGFWDVASAEFAFMDEPLCAENHRGNILSCDFTHVGIGVAVDDSGALWITQDFIGR